jgi:hypothetical protein
MALGKYAVVRSSDTIVVTVADWDPVLAPTWAPSSGYITVGPLAGQQLIDAVPSATYNSGTGVFTPPNQQLVFVQAQKQGQLDGFFNVHFDLAAFIRDGTITTITAAQVGTFIATIANNYRSKRAAIAAALTITAVNAIDVTTGWPANP